MRSSLVKDRSSFASRAPIAGVALTLLLLSSAAHAQNGRVVGRVTETRTALPLAGATIEIAGTRLGAVADGDGRYRIVNVPAGTHAIVARRIGYTAGRQSVTVTGEGEVTANFTLQAAPISLDQVVITGTAGGERLRTIGNSVATINAPKAVELAAPPTLSTLLNARAPGVVINQVSGRLGGGPSINIRGISSIGQGNSPLIYVDGVRIN